MTIARDFEDRFVAAYRSKSSSSLLVSRCFSLRLQPAKIFQAREDNVRFRRGEMYSRRVSRLRIELFPVILLPLHIPTTDARKEGFIGFVFF